MDRAIGKVESRRIRLLSKRKKAQSNRRAAGGGQATKVSTVFLYFASFLLLPLLLVLILVHLLLPSKEADCCGQGLQQRRPWSWPWWTPVAAREIHLRRDICLSLPQVVLRAQVHLFFSSIILFLTKSGLHLQLVESLVHFCC